MEMVATPRSSVHRKEKKEGGWVYMMGVLLSVVIIINDDKENPRGAFVVAVELLIVIEAKVALVP